MHPTLKCVVLRFKCYEVRIRYCPGKSLLVADTLGRAYLPECNTDGSVEQKIGSINMSQYVYISDGRLQAVQ